MAFLDAFGRDGILNKIMEQFGSEQISIYGLGGILIVHIFLNLPLVLRLFILGWESIPNEQYRLAEMLSLPLWKFVERPMLAAIFPGAFSLVFLLCLTSFSTSLILGGGPGATTIELSIYQSLRYDFEPERAALLTVVQLSLCVIATTVCVGLTPRGFQRAIFDRRISERKDKLPRILADIIVIFFSSIFLLLPPILIVVNGLPAILNLPNEVWIATVRSLLIAILTVFLCIGLTLTLALTPGKIAVLAVNTPFVYSSLTFGTGLFLLLNRLCDVQTIAIPVTVFVNALLFMPLAYRAIRPEVEKIQNDFGNLATTLRLDGLSWLRIIILPRIKDNLGFSAGLAGALSMGDVGVMSIFADPRTVTLPLELQRMMSAYRFEEAKGASLLLMVLSVGIFVSLSRPRLIDAET
jgi:thiamine transport system permease protein